MPSATDGLEVRGYVHDLYRHLAACDLAVVQGGLTTTMELTASQRPFIYVPLRHHFEQNFHVRHRLAQYGAGRCLDYDDTVPDVLAAAIAEEIGAPGQLPAGRDRRRGPGRRRAWPSSSERAPLGPIAPRGRTCGSPCSRARCSARRNEPWPARSCPAG